MEVRDLYVVVADKQMEFALHGAFARYQSLGTRKFSYEIDVHSGRDGGVRTSGANLLSLGREQVQHGMLMLDWEGSGASEPTPLDLEATLDAQLNVLWGTDAKSIVIEPELETWMWGNDNMMREVLNWSASSGIRDWLGRQGFSFDEHGKPDRPKEAMEEAARIARLPRSAALFRTIASKISMRHCTDPSFARLRSTLQMWFSPE